jgi:hypothetical protein
MRGVPDHSNPSKDQPAPLSVSVAPPASFTPKEPIPEELAELGREVLELVPRKQRGSLEAYRQAAGALSRVLKVTGVRMALKTLYYLALRVKWLRDNVCA